MAGTLKLMDPVGTSLIVTEYFKFLGLVPLIPSSWWVGEALALCETFLGITVTMGLFKRVTAWISAAFMLTFTILTLILWIANPQMDCGCFGEAVHLTHAQSFMKNVVLDILWVPTFLPLSAHRQEPKIKKKTFPIVAVCTIIFALGFATSIPAVDYTPMATGTELYQEDDFLDNAPVLSFRTPDGEYADSLATTRRVMVISAYNPQKLTDHDWRRMDSLALRARSLRYNVLLLSAGIPEHADSTFTDCTYLADRKTLMTLNRSNGGITYIVDGLIVRKWAARRTPDAATLEKLRRADPTQAAMEADTLPSLSVQGFVIIMFALMLLI